MITNHEYSYNFKNMDLPAFKEYLNLTFTHLESLPPEIILNLLIVLQF